MDWSICFSLFLIKLIESSLKQMRSRHPGLAVTIFGTGSEQDPRWVPDSRALTLMADGLGERTALRQHGELSNGCLLDIRGDSDESPHREQSQALGLGPCLGGTRESRVSEFNFSSGGIISIGTKTESRSTLAKCENLAS